MNIQQINSSLNDILVGWDKLEKPNGLSIVDFNLINHTQGRDYTSRYEVLLDLSALLDNSALQENPVLMRRIKAEEVFLRNLMGEHWEFDRYVEATMGFKPFIFSDDQISAQKSKMDVVLDRAGIKFDQDLRDNIKLADTEIPTAEVGDFYRKVFAENLSKLESIIGKTPEFNLSIEFVDVDAYWWNWVDGAGLDYRLRFNKKHMKQHFNARATSLAYHEILGHLVQSAGFVNSIKNGDMLSSFGITTVHSTCEFQAEGLAQTIINFLNKGEYLGLCDVLSELAYYNHMVNNNTHIMLNSGSSIKDCVDYTMALAPYRKVNEVGDQFNSWQHNPQFRTYEFVYPASLHFFRNACENMNAEETTNFLKANYSRWLDPVELSSL